MQIPLKRSVVAGAIIAGATLAFGAAPSQGAPDGPAIPARIPAVFPATWRFPAGAHAAFAPHAMVASDSRIASEIGAEIMKEGGNAVDAAVDEAFKQIQSSGRETFKETLAKDIAFWSKCERRWGGGPGYRTAIRDMTDERLFVLN